MDPTQIATKAADELFNNGVLGTLAVILLLGLGVAGWAIRRLYNDNQGLHAKFSDKLGEATGAFTASTAAIQETRSTLVAINGTLDTLSKSMTALAHDAERQDADVRHGLANTTQGMGAIGGALEKIKDTLAALNSALQGLNNRGGPL